MRNIKSYELRELFLEFFRSKGHAIIPSASLIPNNDPTVLFTTAGPVMVLVHGFIKKTQKIPKQDLELARARMKEVRHG